jgi:hypothetical protein
MDTIYRTSVIAAVYNSFHFFDVNDLNLDRKYFYAHEFPADFTV